VAPALSSVIRSGDELRAGVALVLGDGDDFVQTGGPGARLRGVDHFAPPGALEEFLVFPPDCAAEPLL